MTDQQRLGGDAHPINEHQNPKIKTLDPLQKK